MPEWYGGSALGTGLGLAPEDQWKAHWSRVTRWHQRVIQLQGKAEETELNNYDMDVVIAYWQNVYHLRDWVEVSHPELKTDLQQLFTTHFELGACRDLCHGFKHKKLSRPTHDAEFNVYREYDHCLAEKLDGPSPIQYRLAFADGDDIKKFDLFQFSETCLTMWQDFLLRKSLL